MSAQSLTSKAPRPLAPSQRESWAGVGVALFPMLIWPVLLALASLRGKLIQTLNAQATQTAGGMVGGWIFLIAVIILITVLTAGWIKDWPRWAFPYIGVMLGVSLMLSNSSTPGLVLFGYTFDRSELWGWR